MITKRHTKLTQCNNVRIRNEYRDILYLLVIWYRIDGDTAQYF